jgi:hypothetical protein
LSVKANWAHATIRPKSARPDSDRESAICDQWPMAGGQVRDDQLIEEGVIESDALFSINRGFTGNV